MIRILLFSCARRWVVLLVLLAMPLQLAGAATFRASGSCCGDGQALVSMANALLMQLCGDYQPPAAGALVLEVGATDCSESPRLDNAPCSDCGIQCGAAAWTIPAHAPPLRASIPSFLLANLVLAVVPAPPRDRVERPPRTGF
jgi:hypothetical protein